jgi:hypothetical protein
VAAFRLDHKQLGLLLIGEGPAGGPARIFRDQDDAVLFGLAALEFAPMLGSEFGIAAAVGLERRLIVLQPNDKGQDRRFVGGQTSRTNTNGRAP